MTATALPRDLIVLVADRNMQATVQGVLQRTKALGIRDLTADVRRHPGTDAGCRDAGVTYLAAFTTQYHHALLMFDHEGCGREDIPPDELAAAIDQSLARAGWQDRAKTIVLVPELDIWVWSDSPHVDEVLGWKDRQPALRQWLADNRYLTAGQTKPARPKEALEAALKLVKKPRSSALYETLAAKVGLGRCTDRAFIQLKTTLQAWFPPDAP